MKSKLSQKGNNNIAIQNSPIQIITNEDLLKQLLSQGKTQEAVNLFRRIINSASAQHPLYPHWRYEIGTDTTGKTFISHVPNSAEALIHYPLHGEVKFIVPDEYKKFKNIDELLKYSYDKQTDIELDAEYLKTWIGDYPLDNMETSDVKNIKVVLKPEAFPPPFKARLLFDNDSFSIDYLEIGLQEIDGDNIIIGNSKQDNPRVYITLNINLCSNNGKFDLSINKNYKHDVKANLIYNKFILNVQRNKDIMLKDLVADRLVFKSKVMHLDDTLPENIEDTVGLLDTLNAIEDYYDVRIDLPERDLNSEDFENISILKSAVEGKEREGVYENLSMLVNDKETISNLLNLYKDDKDSHTLSVIQENKLINLFGTTIQLNKTVCTFQNAMLKDRELLIQKSRLMDAGESIKIVFVPSGESKVLEEYIM